MKSANNKLTDLGLFILRIGFAAPMLTHGWPKLEKLINGGIIQFPDPLNIGSKPSLILAVVGEVVAPIFLIIGFKTRISAVPAAITMGVALFVVHGGNAFKKQELALLYLLAYLAIIILGGGNYSLDGLLRKKGRKH